ncbi:MAG: hypothetical protein IKE59_08595 [Erysipelotrichaceae bacterium]|nr:hypothetical protein [Erysipelotrichaceae bacterium]
MAKRFPGGCFIFDYVSEKGIRGGNAQVKMTRNATTMQFHKNKKNGYDACHTHFWFLY